MIPLDELMKQHEHAYRRAVSPDEYLLLRLDGKAFHSYTKGLDKPFDSLLMEAMDTTLLALVDKIPGVRLGYVESDEISLLITGWRDPILKEELKIGELWMGGIEAKLISLSAAIATAAFNIARLAQVQRLDDIVEAWHEGKYPNRWSFDTALIAEGGLSAATVKTFAEGNFHKGPALFDSRLWTFPSTEEGRELVSKYFYWRRRDSVKNSVTMAALDSFSHKAIHKMKTEQKIEALRENGTPWEGLPDGFKFGRYAHRVSEEKEVSFTHKKTGKLHSEKVTRHSWRTSPLLNLEEISSLIPQPLN